MRIIIYVITYTRRNLKIRFQHYQLKQLVISIDSYSICNSKSVRIHNKWIATFAKVLWSPGLNMIQATTVERSRRRAYMMRDEELFLQEGQALQHMLQAALPQHIASCNKSDACSMLWQLWGRQAIQCGNHFQMSFLVKPIGILIKN